MNKRMISALISITMLLGAMPYVNTAVAAEPEETPVFEVVTEEPVEFEVTEDESASEFEIDPITILPDTDETAEEAPEFTEASEPEEDATPEPEIKEELPEMPQEPHPELLESVFDMTGLSIAAELSEPVSGKCGTNLTWILDINGTLTISGNGKMMYWTSYVKSPWNSYSANIQKVVIGEGVTSIGQNAFYDCSSLTSVTIPDSVTTIGPSAFYGCSSLTSVTIPDGVTTIDWNVFYGCSSLRSVTIPDSVTSIVGQTFCRCSSLSSVTIPDSVTSIGSGVFSGCSSLRSVTIPGSVTSIGNYAFEGCSSLRSVTIPNSVTSIGSYAFEGCSSLRSVPIPNSVTSISDNTFSGCSSLTSLTIPDSVTSIGSYAFEGCSSLTIVTIPDSVASINYKTFSGCSSLTSLTIPDSVTSIGSYAFEGCSSLTDVDIGNGLSYINDSIFSYCDNIENLSISSGSIDSSAFKNKIKLSSVYLGNGVTRIGFCAFSGCSSLTSVTIPSSVTEIGWGAFSDCKSLWRVSLTESVTSIGGEAFKYCPITSVSFHGTESEWEKISFTPTETYKDYYGITHKTYKYVTFFAPTAVQSISISGENKVSIGKQIRLNVSFSPFNATNKALTWSSSDTSVAKVNSGCVTGIQAGTATITATSANGKTASMAITVGNIIQITDVYPKSGSKDISIWGNKLLNEPDIVNGIYTEKESFCTFKLDYDEQIELSLTPYVYICEYDNPDNVIIKGEVCKRSGVVNGFEIVPLETTGIPDSTKLFVRIPKTAFNIPGGYEFNEINKDNKDDWCFTTEAGLTYGRDMFSFMNIYTDFLSDDEPHKYLLSDNANGFLKTICGKEYNSIIKKMNSDWGGACYGISAVTIFNDAGLTNEGYGNLYNMSMPRRKVDLKTGELSLRDKLHIYNLSQYMDSAPVNRSFKSIWDGYYEITKNGDWEYTSKLERIVNRAYEIPSKGCFMLTFGYRKKGEITKLHEHAVVVNRIRSASDGSFILDIYDSAFPPQMVTHNPTSLCTTILKINSDYSDCEFVKGYDEDGGALLYNTVRWIGYLEANTLYDFIYNHDKGKELLTTRVYLSKDEIKTITSKSATVTFDADNGFEFDGEVTVYLENNIRGDGEPRYIIEFPTNDDLEITPLDGDCDIEILSPDYYACIDSDNVTKVVYSNNAQSVAVEGTGMNGSLYIPSESNDVDLMKINMKNETHMAVSQSNDKTEIASNKGCLVEEYSGTDTTAVYECEPRNVSDDRLPLTDEETSKFNYCADSISVRLSLSEPIHVEDTDARAIVGIYYDNKLIKSKVYNINAEYPFYLDNDVIFLPCSGEDVTVKAFLWSADGKNTPLNKAYDVPKEDGPVTENYGVIVGSYQSSGDTYPTVRLITSDAKVVAYECKDDKEAKEFYNYAVNGNANGTDAWHSFLKSTIKEQIKSGATVCKYTVVSGKIRFISPMQAVGGSDLTYDAYNRRFGSYLIRNDVTKIIDMEKYLEDYVNDTTISTMNADDFEDDSDYTVYFYDKNMSGIYRFAIVVGGTSSIRPESQIAVIQKSNDNVTTDSIVCSSYNILRECHEIEMLYENTDNKLEEGTVIAYTVGSGGYVRDGDLYVLYTPETTYESSLAKMLNNDDFCTLLGNVSKVISGRHTGKYEIAYNGVTSNTKDVFAYLGVVHRKSSNTFEMFTTKSNGVTSINDTTDFSISGANIYTFDYSARPNKGVRLSVGNSVTQNTGIFNQAYINNKEDVVWANLGDAVPQLAFVKEVDGDVTDVVFFVAP